MENSQVPFLTKTTATQNGLQHKATNKKYNNLASQSHRPYTHTHKSKEILQIAHKEAIWEATYTDITLVLAKFMGTHAHLHTCSCVYHAR